MQWCGELLPQIGMAFAEDRNGVDDGERGEPDRSKLIERTRVSEVLLTMRKSAVVIVKAVGRLCYMKQLRFEAAGNSAASNAVELLLCEPAMKSIMLCFCAA